MPKSVAGVLREFKHGQLHSGSSTGQTVTSRKQAIAIALSEQRKQGKAVPPPKRQLHPALKQRAQMVREGHAHLKQAMPGFSKLPPAKQIAMAQHHVKVRKGEV